eukprot:CAMPEP_0113861464 /NCGR_PEP_ID=MMETSP0372-20130328/14394_1 /TAXON_ID=340204 /ORGANISM="Lankesteria abbotti" /LENGTH=291 /DNA_ID=CAMNT_0000841755 /DNA_START=145 /DNA_END=1020 /DNA_ORIENTATION=+ /assembly_acc=CAM_ASM_000359
MERHFGCAGNLTRIPAADFLADNLEDMLFGFGGNITTLDDYAKAAGAKKGEIALSISQLRAIKQAYDDGVDAAIVFEDDALPVASPFWPVSFDEIKRMADEQIPEWQAISLQWTPPLHQTVLQQVKMRRETPQVIIGKRRTSSLFGAVAIMWRRRGMELMLKHHTNDEGKFGCRFVKGYFCIYDFLIYRAVNVHRVVSPAPITNSLLEDSTGVRTSKKSGKNDKIVKHMQSALISLFANIEQWEFDLVMRTADRKSSFKRTTSASGRQSAARRTVTQSLQRPLLMPMVISH